MENIDYGHGQDEIYEGYITTIVISRDVWEVMTRQQKREALEKRNVLVRGPPAVPPGGISRSNDLGGVVDMHAPRQAHGKCTEAFSHTLALTFSKTLQ